MKPNWSVQMFYLKSFREGLWNGRDSQNFCHHRWWLSHCHLLLHQMDECASARYRGQGHAGEEGELPCQQQGTLRWAQQPPTEFLPWWKSPREMQMPVSLWQSIQASGPLLLPEEPCEKVLSSAEIRNKSALETEQADPHTSMETTHKKVNGPAEQFNKTSLAPLIYKRERDNFLLWHFTVPTPLCCERFRTVVFYAKVFSFVSVAGYAGILEREQC